MKRFLLVKTYMCIFAIACLPGVALASAPKSDNSDLGVNHQVYTDETLPGIEDYATNGIASVSYVNKIVDVIGRSAAAAEAHAAAAGAQALSAAQSAATALGALDAKLEISQ